MNLPKLNNNVFSGIGSGAHSPVCVIFSEISLFWPQREAQTTGCYALCRNFAGQKNLPLVLIALTHKYLLQEKVAKKENKSEPTCPLVTYCTLF